MLTRPAAWPRALLCAGLLALCAGPCRAQIGLMFSGAGASNLSMGGTAVATAVDSTGAMYWNPATLSGLERSEMSIAVGLLYPQERVASSIPLLGLAGSDRSDSGTFAVPSGSLAYRPDGSDWTFGFGIFPVAGFGVNYPASLTNPILTPQPPAGVGLGAIYSSLTVLQIATAASYQLTDRVSVAAGPLLDLANLRLDPAVITPPDTAGGAPRYPGGTHTRFSWGGGFHAGAYVTLDGGWRLGAAFQSPRWVEHFQFRSVNGAGRPRAFSFGTDLPLIASVGAAYAGVDRWLFAADVRYVGYDGAKGLGEGGFDAQGALRGAGWRSVPAVALGAAHQLNDSLSLRAGYTWNNNPIPDALASLNVGAPVIIEHVVYVGAVYSLTDSFLVSASYQHGFQNSITGPLVTPRGPVPGTSLSSTASADSFVLGMTVRFGGGPGACEE